MDASSPESKIHVFERAGLGKAPFRVVGVERRVGPIVVSEKDGVTLLTGAPGQPMGVCDYCGTGIAECWQIKSADGKRFEVGCDCVSKTGDGGLKRQMNAEKRRAKAISDGKRIEAAKALLDSKSETLDVQSHPFPSMAEKGYTLLDYVQFLLCSGGAAGKLKAARIIERGGLEKKKA